MNGNLIEFHEQLKMDFNGVIILKYNNTSKYSDTFDSGISVTIEKVERILQMMLLVPPMVKGGYDISSLFSVHFNFNSIRYRGRQRFYSLLYLLPAGCLPRAGKPRATPSLNKCGN